MSDSVSSAGAESPPASRQNAEPFRNHAIPLIGIALAVTGIILSFVLTKGFFQHTVLAEATGCAISSYINCDKISDSSFAAIGPVPIASFALGLHGAVLVALIAAHMSPLRVREGLAGGTAVMAIGATMASVILAVISIVVIQALCLYCTALQLVNLALAGTLVFGLTGGAAHLKQAMKAIVGSALGIGVFALCIGAGATFVVTYSLVNAADNELLERRIAEARAAQRLADRYLSAERFQFSLTDSPQLGDPNALITLVVYADYNCPHCRVFDPKITGIVRAAEDVRLIYKFFPLDSICNPYMSANQRSTSCAAAAAAYVAHQEGKFWEYIEMLFANFQQYDPDQLVEYGRRVGLSNPERVRSALNEIVVLAKIHTDIAEAVEAGLRSTPTLYINGRMFMSHMVPPGRDQFSVIRSLLDEARGG